MASEELRGVVIAARELQLARAGQLNSQLSGMRLRELLKLSQADQNLLQSAASRLGLSAEG